MNVESLDLIIIGGGPAGLTAALYAGRYRLSTLLLEQLTPGGQILLSPAIENYPGFPEGIATQELIDRFKQQIDALEVTVLMQEATSLEVLTDDPVPLYRVRTQEDVYIAKSVIIACGAVARRLDVKGEEAFIGKGVSYCGTCDAPFFRNKEIVVVGGGDRAFEEALFLSNYASKVTLIHRRDKFRASKILEEKARKDPKISFLLNSVVTEVKGSATVEGVGLKNLKTGEESVFPTQGIFVFVGIRPNTGFLKDVIETDEAGFIVTDEQLQTSRKGMYACGDCRKKKLYQVVIACGEGAVAAYSAHGYVLNL